MTSAGEPARSASVDAAEDNTGFSGARPPAAFNMADYAIGRSARAYPDKVALLVTESLDGKPQETWTFAELELGALKAGAALLALGLEPGDRLLIQLPNTSTYALTFFGAVAVGLIPIPASDQLTVSEVGFLICDSGARCVLGQSAVVAPVRRNAADYGITHDVTWIDPEELDNLTQTIAPATYAVTTSDTPAYLIYTSGTTSKPKGVLHAHRAAWGRRPMYRGWYGLGPDDRMLHAGAFNWTYTLGTGLTDPWANGATAVVYTGEKTPDIWPRLIARTQATLFAAVPGLYRQILKYAANDLGQIETLRHGLMAGEAPPADLIGRWHDVTRRPLYEALGMSEISTYISTGPDTPSKIGATGQAQPGRAIAILDPDASTPTLLEPGQEGLLAIHRSDPGMMLGYWNRPDEEAEVFHGPWFAGGDLAVIADDGYVSHRGRANDIIKALGYRISPMEVEAALITHAGVAEVACAEVPVKDGVTVVGAFIVPANPDQPPRNDELDALASASLAQYKRPRLWRIISALPRTKNGKLKRAALLDLV